MDLQYQIKVLQWMNLKLQSHCIRLEDENKRIKQELDSLPTVKTYSERIKDAMNNPYIKDELLGNYGDFPVIKMSPDLKALFAKARACDDWLEELNQTLKIRYNELVDINKLLRYDLNNEIWQYMHISGHKNFSVTEDEDGNYITATPDPD